jgi:hypothetical protein
MFLSVRMTIRYILRSIWITYSRDKGAARSQMALF